jgi:hypothetical protein
MPLPEGDRRTGDFTVYGYYIKTLGFGRSMIFLVLMAGYVFFISFPCKFPDDCDFGGRMAILILSQLSGYNGGLLQM